MKITLCGSAKFEKDFKDWNKTLSLNGHVVYSLAVYPSDMGGKNWYTEDQKTMLDRVHKEKILNSDAIFVINRDGYIGDSTRSEILFAKNHGKKIIYAHNENLDIFKVLDTKAMWYVCHLGPGELSV